MLSILICFISAFVITYFSIPSLIRIAHIRNLFDEPDERKLHKTTIPALGGVALFCGIFFTTLFWSDSLDLAFLRWFILSLVIIFLMGLKDDVVSIDPVKKLMGEIVASGLIIYYTDLRIYSFQGLFGIQELPFVISLLFTMFVFIVLINAINLIDGIDGLAGGIGTICCLALGGLFWYSGDITFAAISFTMAGALLGFLRFNFSPAKIFMGDAGSLVLGFLLAVLSVKFINSGIVIGGLKGVALPAPAITLAILIIPLADTLRVFIIRTLRGRSPFSADRNHLHHMLLDLGLGHQQTAMLLFLTNLLFISAALLSSELNINILFAGIVMAAFLLSQVPFLLLREQRNSKELEKKKLKTQFSK